ncbi:MAG: ECF-type sigma factor [Vicinamibacterales bacterium]
MAAAWPCTKPWRTSSKARPSGSAWRRRVAAAAAEAAQRTATGLDDALTTLGAFDERKSKVVELRFFGGLSLHETAEALDVSVATISRELRFAQAWLQSSTAQGHDARALAIDRRDLSRRRRIAASFWIASAAATQHCVLTSTQMKGTMYR